MKEIPPEKFGPGTWFTMHTFAKMCDRQKKERQHFISFLNNVIRKLPCKVCRKHSNLYINEHPLKDDEEVFMWTWKFHNNVNERLGKRVVPYEEANEMFANAEIIIEDGEKTCSKCGAEGINVKVIDN